MCINLQSLFIASFTLFHGAFASPPVLSIINEGTSGTEEIRGSVWQATAFETGFENLSFSKVILKISGTSNFPTNLSIGIYSDQSSVPGMLISELEDISEAVSGPSRSQFTFDSPDAVIFPPYSTYWIVAANPLDEDNFRWSLTQANDSFSNSGWTFPNADFSAYSDDSGTTWQPNTTGRFQFELYAIPEPQFLLLLLLSLSMLTIFHNNLKSKIKCNAEINRTRRST